MTDTALAQLAEAAGILIDWEDASGRPQRVTPDTLRVILGQLDLPATSAAECRDSLHRLTAQVQAASTDVLTTDVGMPIPLPALAGKGELIHEDGTRLDVSLAGHVPAIDRPGYHRLTWSGGQLTIAVAPPRGHPVPVRDGTRPWGIAAQLYALRDATPSPFGDFGTLASIAGTAGAHGVDAIAISPVHALFAADPTRYSPYAPSSRQFLNPLFATAPAAANGVAPDLIDWPAAAADKLDRLRTLYETLDGPTRTALDAEPSSADLDGHALFETLHGHFFRQTGAGAWQDWPAAYHDPTSAAVAAFASEHADTIRFHRFLQWIAERSLTTACQAAKGAGMAIGLISDIAVGLDPGGSHAWNRRSDLIMGLGIGAPPDAYQANGQNWGITSFSPTALRETGFHPFLAMLRAAMRHSGGVRIDHALGLRRLWVVPHGASPLDGAYLRYPEQDLLRLIALESHRAGAIVIGEDLGVVPPGFRDGITARGIYGMRVLPFERDADGAFTPPSTWPAQAVAMTSTHDMVPIAGWWRGTDIEWRTRIDPAIGADAQTQDRAADRTRLWDAFTASGAATVPPPLPDDPAPVVDAALAQAAAAPCELLIVPVEDLFGLEEAPNMPGTITEHPNWRRRLPDTGDALFATAAVRRRIARIVQTRTR
ncbi:MAG TPA: 4-alpha-glucanotransferase [Sphingomonas sp.]|jgi:4-alpha-glucanotransferase|uniref:4-alpha-glucanotransferase n=1 Tax=Sphingomonas sp. TaxID=28214 RepID=UPI002EDA8CBD